MQTNVCDKKMNLSRSYRVIHPFVDKKSAYVEKTCSLYSYIIP